MFLCAYKIGNGGFNIREKELFKKIGITVPKENGYEIAVKKFRLEIRMKSLTV